VHVRKERFCEGELGAWVACGRAARVLRRLHSLAA
jgi:hypothetical protein